MPGFSSIVGNIAKVALDHLGNKTGNNSSQNHQNTGGSQTQFNQPYNQSYNGQPYGQPQGSQPYGQPQGSQPYGQHQGSQPYDQPQGSQPYGNQPYNNQNQPYSSQGQTSNYQPYQPYQGNLNQPHHTSYNYNQQPMQPINAGMGFNSGDMPYPSGPSNFNTIDSQAQTPYPSSGSYFEGQQQSNSMYPSFPSEFQHYPAYGQSSQMTPQAYQQQPTMYSNPSIKPYPHFNANQDAEVLRNAMKGLGCNKTRVIEVLCARSNAQRQDIARVFKTMYGKDLSKDLKSELSGDFEELILALMEDPLKYDASQLHKAMARIGTRENVLIEIMTSRTNAQIFQLKQAYAQMYGRELENHLVSETSGYFKRLLVSMCAGGRDESGQTNALRANQDAHQLYRAGEQRLGTDEAQFSAIIAAQNHSQLRLVFHEYEKIAGHSIEQAIAAEFSGDIKDGLLSIVKMVSNRAVYFAEQLYNSMKGLGTRDTDLIRIVVTRSEVDLADIRNEYQRMYGTSLEQAIAGDCSGAYKEGLIALVKGN